jgi:hypothetical protein
VGHVATGDALGEDHAPIEVAIAVRHADRIQQNLPPRQELSDDPAEEGAGGVVELGVVGE